MSEAPRTPAVGDGVLVLPYGSVRRVASEALAEAWTVSIESHADVAQAYGSLRSVVGMLLAAVSEEKDTPAAAGAEFTPLTVRWDGEVIPLEGPDDEDSVVCCSAVGGRPVALVLGPDEGDALGLALLGDDDGLVYQAYHGLVPVGPLYWSHRAAVAHVTELLVQEHGEPVRTRISWSTPAGDEAVPCWDAHVPDPASGEPGPTSGMVIALAVASAYAPEPEAEG